jgi:hypothetical protein
MTGDLILSLGMVAAIAVSFYLYVQRHRTKQWSGELTLPNGHTYLYVLGDYMRLYKSGGEYHGIAVVLPKEMPHIYLDSMHAGRHVRFIIDPSQRLKLEGNFDTDFWVFAPKQHEAVALSILSPDVMVTLQRYATAFDVEVFGDQVRVISAKHVTHNKELQEALVHVAMKVMIEIDHRLASWGRSGSLAARDQDLHMYPTAGLRLFGRYATYWFIGWTIYWVLACFGLGVGAAVAVAHPELPRELRIFLPVLFGVILILCIGVTHRRWRTESFRTRRGWKYSDEKRRQY